MGSIAVMCATPDGLVISRAAPTQEQPLDVAYDSTPVSQDLLTRRLMEEGRLNKLFRCETPSGLLVLLLYG
jgi:hypothetical protein